MTAITCFFLTLFGNLIRCQHSLAPSLNMVRNCKQQLKCVNPNYVETIKHALPYTELKCIDRS